MLKEDLRKRKGITFGQDGWNYGFVTVRDLVNLVQNARNEDGEELYPWGLDTPIITGDHEGNTRHELHSVSEAEAVKVDPKLIKKLGCLYVQPIFLSFELNEYAQ